MIKAINRNVIVFEAAEIEKKSAGGLILTDNRVDYSSAISNMVLSVGDEVKYVKEGDRVYYLPRTGDVIKREEGVYRIMDETQILGVEEN